ncbi:MAG: hypothetical protein ABI856_11915 [Nitrospira sp.]
MGESPAQAQVVSFSAEEYAFNGPEEVETGWQMVRLINHGHDVHQVQFLGLPPGKTVDDVKQALAGRLPRLPNWLRRHGGVNSVAPGHEASVVIHLDPGKYVLLCGIPDATGRPHAMQGMVRSLQVSGPGSRVVAPPQSHKTVSLKDFSFSLSEPLQVDDHILRLFNEGTQAHEMVVIRLAEGASTQDFLTSYRPGGARNPAGAEVGGMTGIDPGREAYVHLDMQLGRYGLICFLADPVSGTSHVVHGMWMDLDVQQRSRPSEGP